MNDIVNRFNLSPLALPKPEELAEYEKSLQGSGIALLKQWQEQQEVVRAAIESDIKSQEVMIARSWNFKLTCLFLGTFLGFSALTLAAFGIFNKADLKDLAIMITPISVLAGIFLVGSKKD